MQAQILARDEWKKRYDFFDEEFKRITAAIEADDTRGRSEYDADTRTDMVKQAMFLADTLDSLHHRLREEDEGNRFRWIRHQMEQISSKVTDVVVVDGNAMPPNIVDILEAAMEIKKLAAELAMVDL